MSGDLRAAVEGLTRHPLSPMGNPLVARSAVLDLIPYTEWIGQQLMRAL